MRNTLSRMIRADSGTKGIQRAMPGSMFDSSSGGTDSRSVVGMTRPSPSRSLHGLQVVDHVGALLGVRDAGERHVIAGNRLLRIDEEGVEAFFVPRQSGTTHGAAVGEAAHGAGLAPVNAFQSRADAVGSVGTVAGRASGEGGRRLLGDRSGGRQAGQDEIGEEKLAHHF